MSEIIQISNNPITSHAFNHDRSLVAFCPNSSQIHIHSLQPFSDKPIVILNGHDQVITCIDWAPNTNRIVTCSQDRNAYVWNLVDGEWKPTLVLLRINRAATFVKWSPNEEKFAVASGARLISICYFEQENDWWVSKHLKKPIKSTVLGLDWHPNNVLLASGGADNKACVFSAYIKGLDSKPAPSVWGDKLPFNTICAEYSANGWVHSVSFSPSGDLLAFVSHDSTVTIADPAKNVLKVITTAGLPFMCCDFVSENLIVAAGFDAVPVAFGTEKGEWKQICKLEEESMTLVAERKGLPGSFAFNRFKQMDSKGQEESTNDTLSSTHQNFIRTLFQVGGKKLSTSGLDGKLVFWDLLAPKFQQLLI